MTVDAGARVVVRRTGRAAGMGRPGSVGDGRERGARGIVPNGPLARSVPARRDGTLRAVRRWSVAAVAGGLVWAVSLVWAPLVSAAVPSPVTFSYTGGEQ